MVLVVLSGFHILYPSRFAVFGTMNTARKVHFFGMYLIIFPMIFRFIYHVWVTGDLKKYMVTPKDLTHFPAFVRYYTFRSKEKPWGHDYNLGQKAAYMLWPLLLILQAVTGFAIYWPDKLGGVAAFFGGVIYLKLWHTVIAWIFVTSVVLHVYLGSTGITVTDLYRSMVTGYETVEAEE